MPDASGLVARDAEERFLRARRRAQVAIARIDEALSAQLDRIVHHPRFQRLEAAWRGLAWLVDQTDGMRGIKLRVLNATWAEITRDLERATEFDQSQVFARIYTDEFDMPGGEPYGIIVADYEITASPRDVAALRSLADVAAAAFTPIILAASPKLFGLDTFAQLSANLDLAALFQAPEYTAWRSLRGREDTRFIGITLPRVLLRLPRRSDGSRRDGFRYEEDATAADGSEWLWGHAGLALAATVLRSYGQWGWFADIRGVRTDADGGGLVDKLPAAWFMTDRPGIAGRLGLEVALSERHERELSDLGFVPAHPPRHAHGVVFHSNQSLHRPPHYDRAAARANAKLSSMLQHAICAARFAHYVKVMTREKIGSFTTADAIERGLNDWLLGYCMNNDSAPLATKAKYPLKEARAEVREQPGKPGHYNAVVHLLPQFQLDEVAAMFRLVTTVAPARAA
jgi:type VI secretion system protein ImpD